MTLCDVYCDVPGISLCRSIGHVWLHQYITNWFVSTQLGFLKNEEMKIVHVECGKLRVYICMLAVKSVIRLNLFSPIG